MRSDPAGTIKQRADGAVWVKPTSTAKEWKQVKDGHGPQTKKTPGGEGGPSDLDAPGDTVDRPWSQAQARYDLDGHLPPEEVHPQFVELDAEGNIDEKPVLMWKDQYGASRRSYTKRFHWNRYSQVHEQSAELGDAIAVAYAKLEECCVEGHPKREAATAALVHLKTGQPIEAVLALSPERTHVAREMKKSSSEELELLKGSHTSKLREVLTATIALRDRTQNFHWNVSGPLFPSLHALFGAQYDDLATAADDIAERIRALGEQVEEVEVEPRLVPTESLEMVRELALSHQALSALCEAGVQAAEVDGDSGTVDLLGKRAASHDKAGWMLRVTSGMQKGGATTDRAHPDRAHFMFDHARGHAYATSLAHEAVADFVYTKRQQEGNDRLFDCSARAVQGVLNKAGLRGANPDAVRHHVVATMAADFLSKTPSVKLAEVGIDGARVHLQAASDHLANHFGHDSAPVGMSYVPPAIALAYLEDAGAAKLYPKSYDALRGVKPEQTKTLDSTITKAKELVLKTFGTLEGHEAEVGLVSANLQRKQRKLNKGTPCYPTEDASSSSSAPATPSSETTTSPSTLPSEELKSSTPGPSSPPSPTSPELHLQLDEGLEKGAQYLARLSPAPGDVRARYVYNKAALLALLESDAFANVMTRGVRFWCPMLAGNKLVDGFISIEDRVSTLVTASHSGTGRVGSSNVEELRKLLLDYHMTEQPVKKSANVALANFGERQPEAESLREQAAALYLSALQRSLVGGIEDRVMREINLALLSRDYDRVIELSKGQNGPPAIHPARVPPTTSQPEAHGPTGRGKAAPKPTGELSTADRIKRLRARYKTASEDEKPKILAAIKKLKSKEAGVVKEEGTDMKKANTAVMGLLELEKVATDPMDAWLHKSAFNYQALDMFILESGDDFSDFAVDLSVAPTSVRSQAHHLRIVKGDKALRHRFQVLKAGVR